MPMLGDAATAFDTSLATEFLGKAEATITSFWSSNQTAIMSVLGIVVVLTLTWLGIKLFKRATGKA